MTGEAFAGLDRDVKSVLRYLLLSFLLLAAPAWAAATAFEVSTATGQGEPTQIMSLRDTAVPAVAGPLEPPPPDAAWQAEPLGVRALGFEHKGFWTRTVLRNSSETPRHGWLVITDPFIDQVDCLVTSEATNEAMVYRMGDKRPFDARPVNFPSFIVPVNVFPDSEMTVQCRLRNNGVTAVVFQFWEPQQYAIAERQRAFMRALSYGALGFSILVAIVLAGINVNGLAILLVVDLLPVLIATAAREGDAFQLLWPAHPELNIPPYMWIMVGAVTASLVYRWIIALTAWEQRVLDGMAMFSAVLLGLSVASPVLGPPIAAFVQAIALLYPLYLIHVCVRHWQDGPVPRVLFIGMAVQYVALVLNALGVLGFLPESFGAASLYASVVKALALAAALFYRMKLDRLERTRAQAAHTQELERRVAYEAQLRHAVSHHPRYGMPNQAMLEETVRARLTQHQGPVSVWIVKLNRFGFLESILPPDTLTSVVKIYAEELQHWFTSPARVQAGLLSIEGPHRIAALDDSSLAFVTTATAGDTLLSDLEAFLTRRFEWQGIFVAWDPHVGVSQADAAQIDAVAGVTDEARIALQWCSAHQRLVRFDAERMKREQLAYGLTLDLEGAIDRGELLLHYQPKVTLSTRRTDSLEALVRWRHPERGMIPPGAFIAEAEATGAINRLTMWAIGEAARFLLTLPEPHVRVSVNITAFDLATPRFVDKVLEILAREGCSPHRLILEVTESAALSDRDRAMQILSRLRAEGVKIALDDFGTGHSSLGILQEMPLDEMKVDRSFVTDLAGFGRKQAVLQAMIDVGHRLGLSVTIEGVEHAESVDWLDKNGCDVVQGYFFSRPLEADAARRWLSAASPEGDTAATNPTQRQVKPDGGELDTPLTPAAATVA